MSALERLGKLNSKAPATFLTFRLAFISNMFDLETCPSFVSAEIESEVDSKKRVVQHEMVWTEEGLPQLHTTLNTPELAKQSSFLMLLFGTKTAD